MLSKITKFMTQTSAVGLNSNEKGVEATCFLYKREILTAKSERIDCLRCVDPAMQQKKKKKEQTTLSQRKHMIDWTKNCKLPLAKKKKRKKKENKHERRTLKDLQEFSL